MNHIQQNFIPIDSERILFIPLSPISHNNCLSKDDIYSIKKGHWYLIQILEYSQASPPSKEIISFWNGIQAPKLSY